MAINKRYLYKVYRPQTVTRYNRIWQGNFEGNFPVDHLSRWTRYWSAYNGAAVRLYRKDSYTGFRAGTGIRFDGQRAYMNVPYKDGLNPTTIAAMAMWEQDNWNTGNKHAFIGNYVTTSIGVNYGWGILANHSEGYLSAVIGKGTTDVYEVKVLLSELSAGLHALGIYYDGAELKLYVDGAIADQTTIESIPTDIVYHTAGGDEPGVAVGAAYTENTIFPAMQFSRGTCHQLVLYTAGTLPSDNAFARFWTTYAPQQSDSVDDATFIYNFDDVVENSTRTTDDMQRWPAEVHNVEPVTSPVGVTTCVRVVTDTGGSATQGLSLANDLPAITGGQKYFASAWVKGTAGQTINMQVNPVGGGLPASKPFIFTGQWQRIGMVYDAHASATALGMDIYLSDANVGTRTFYVDAVQLEDGEVLHDYFDKDADDRTGALYYSDSTVPVHIARLKEYEYVTTYKDVVSEFDNDFEINTAGGGDVTITLKRPADDFGEGVDVDFGLHVMVWVVDDNYPNGLLRYQGKIENYEPDYSSNEGVDLMLLGYGADLDLTMLEAGENVVVNQDDMSGVRKSFNNPGLDWRYVGQAIKIPATIDQLAAIQVHGSATRWQYNDNPDPKGTPIWVVVDEVPQNIRLRLWESYEDAQTDSYSDFLGVAPLAEVTINIDNVDAKWLNFQFTDTAGNEKPLAVLPNRQYYFTLTADGEAGATEPGTAGVTTSDNNNYSDGFLFRSEGVAGNVEYPNSDICFRLVAPYGSTRVTYASVDVGAMMRSIMDDNARQGGMLTYDEDSIELTGTLTTYPFNTNTHWEALSTGLKVAPEGWYLFIDEAEMKVHFHPKTHSTIHTLVLGRDFKKASFEKRLEGVRNVIIVIGGPNPANPSENLMRQYVNQASIDTPGIGRRVMRISDGRVTNLPTMDIMGKTALANNSPPEVRTTLEILPGGYNIESIKPGDTIRLRGFTSEATTSLWDRDNWDEMSWDYDVKTPETLDFQIARFGYNPALLTVTLSTAPPDINKRIEEIRRNLEAQQNTNNPSAPDVVS